MTYVIFRWNVVCILLTSTVATFTARSANEIPASIPADVKAILELQQQEISDLRNQVEKLEQENTPAAENDSGFRLSDHLILGGRGAIAYFNSEKNGSYPNNEFRVDEARLHLNVKLDEDMYLFTEIMLADRDDGREETWLGEFYVDFEEVTQYAGLDLPINLRVGRFDIPYGEEYKERDAIDDPLISHSLTDFWGIDEGLAVYGAADKWDYIVAVQNGGQAFFNDYNSDKSVTARVGFNPDDAWRFSVSAMRTGDLDTIGDESSEIWYGNGVFVGIDDAATNGTFNVELLELDIRYRWSSGHVAAMTGVTRYDDDSAGDNQHDSIYYSVEAVQDITDRLYAAARFSRIESDEGMPIIGQGTYMANIMNPDLVTEIWRMSAGLGYRVSEYVIVKTEYSAENGERLSGQDLDDQDLVSAQVAFGF